MKTDWLWAAGGTFAIMILFLLVKIYLLRKAAREIEQAFVQRLTTDTNTLIDISSRDKYMRRLAASMNTELRRLRSQRLRFQQGDRELKNAIASISHDLRTPLTAILGYLALLEKEEKSDTVKRYTDIIKNRADLLGQLSEELFQYSVLIAADEMLSAEPVDLNEVLEESLAAFYSVLVNAGITPCVRMPEEKIVRNLNRAALSRVLSNLLHNAVKYSGGDLDIRLSDTGEFLFSNQAPDLDEIQTKRLFERFYTVESARKSTGLGLSIAKTLVERMGGTISAESKNGRLQIRILFPGAS